MNSPGQHPPSEGPTRETPPGSDEELLVALVEEALRVSERGEEPDLPQICAAYPELVPAVAEALGMSSVVSPAGPESPLSGTLLIDRYRIGQCVGLGAMGSVHKAHDQKLDRQVASRAVSR